jgi:cell division protein FtsN
VGSVTPSSSTDDDAKRKADQLKRQEQAKREAEKREAAKRAEEKKKRELAKKKQAEEEKAAAAKSEEKKDDSVRAPATKSGGYSYTVYGGTYLSSEEAEKDRAKLGAIGLSGSVISTAGDYLLLVGRLDDQDSAAALSNKLHNSGFGSAFVTRKAK